MMCSDMMTLGSSMNVKSGMRMASCAPMMKRGAMPVKEEYKSSNFDQMNDNFADKLIE